MSVLVTGGSGFIGSALVQELESAGHDVLTFNSSDGDLCGTDLDGLYQGRDIRHVFHLAARTFVPDSWLHPGEFYRVAVTGTSRVLDFCRSRGIPLTHVSAYIYGVQDRMPIAEDAVPRPNNPYAHSKYLAEEVCRFYHRYMGVRVCMVRPFNAFGIGQNPDFLIPHIIRQVLTETQIHVKSLTPKRDFIYLDDLVEGLLKTMGMGAEFAVINLGSGSALSVAEIIAAIQEVAGTDKPVVSEEMERINEIPVVVADIQRAEKQLGWRPRHTFAEGIRKILAGMSPAVR